jgi:hypothetical protein
MMTRKNLNGGKKSSGGDVRQFGVPVQHKRQCIGKDGWTGAGLYGFRREMPPKRSRTRNSAEKSKYVTCNGMQPNATGKLALDIGVSATIASFSESNGAGSPKITGSTLSNCHGS